MKKPLLPRIELNFVWDEAAQGYPSPTGRRLLHGYGLLLRLDGKDHLLGVAKEQEKA